MTGRKFMLPLLAVFLMTLLPAARVAAQRSTRWRLTLSARDKGPYGAWLAHESLKTYFPATQQKDLRKSYQFTSIGPAMSSPEDSATLLVLAGFELGLTEEEWINILAFATAGNEIIVFGSIIDQKILEHFGFAKITSPNEGDRPGRYDLSANRKALRLESDTSRAYGYTGRHIRSYFTWGSNTNGDPDAEPYFPSGSSDGTVRKKHTVRPKVLGRTGGHVDFMRYDVGDGHITMHAAPLVLSNYFLLQPGNRAYLDSVWHSLPANISKVYWSDYYRRTESKPSSPLAVLWRHPSTRAALLLFLVGMLLYVLFSIKRRQRIIPIVKPVENSSVQFVETIGRLYYNQGVHSNLAGKMSQHFLDWVRSVYYLDTAVLNDAFVTALAAKSGFPAEEVRGTVSMLNTVRSGAGIDENYLYRFHNALQKFYARHPYSQI